MQTGHRRMRMRNRRAIVSAENVLRRRSPAVSKSPCDALSGPWTLGH